MKKSDKKKVVIQSNILIESKHEFTLIEFKMFLCLVAQLDPKDRKFNKSYRIYFSDFLRDVNLKGQRYDYIKQVALRLRSRSLALPLADGKGENIDGYVSNIHIYPDEPFIDCFISREMKPFLLQLRKNFTMFDLSNVMNLKSIYSILLYQLCKQYEPIGHRTIELKELRFILGIEDKYGVYGNLKTKVIEVARRELAKHSDIFFTYKNIKRGRKIIALKFFIKKQKQRRFNFSKDKPDTVLEYADVLRQQKELEELDPGLYEGP